MFGVCQGATVVALFVRLSGLSVPTYCWLMLKQIIRRPFWESSRDRLVNGEPDPAAEAGAEGPAGVRYWGGCFPAGRRASRSRTNGATSCRRRVISPCEESMRAGQDFVKEGMRALWRG